MNRYHLIAIGLIVLGVLVETLINENILGGIIVMSFSFLAGLFISKKAEDWHPLQCLIPVVLIILITGSGSKALTGLDLSVIGCEIACVNTFFGLGYYKLKRDKFM
jgi:hypothetical protein